MMNLRLAGMATAALALMALAAAMLWYRGEAIAARASAEKYRVERDGALEANRMLDKALTNMTRLRQRENEILAGLTLELRGINDRFSAQAAERTDLEAANETVHDYLDTPIPDDLRRLYNP